MIRIIALFSTLFVGFFYTRKELKALVSCITQKDYVNWVELNKAVAKRESGLY